MKIIDSFSCFIKKKPFFSGILAGILIGFVVGILLAAFTQKNGFTSSDQLILEDYLRLSISDYAKNQNQTVAKWRYSQLGEKGAELLRLMEKDSETDPMTLVQFSQAADAGDDITLENEMSSNGTADETGKSETGLSKFSTFVLILLIVLVIAAAFYYGSALKRNNTPRRKRVTKADAIQPRTGDKLSDKANDDGFESEKVVHRMSFDDEDKNSLLHLLKNEDELDLEATPEKASSDLDSETADFEDISENETIDSDDDGKEVIDLSETKDTPSITEKNRVESEVPSELSEQKKDLELPELLPAAATIEETPVARYQATYQLGDDLFDETFSLDQEDDFLGECGIGIAETINNTDPKAVTAFEVWLFDRRDTHTPTYYLLSDFAYNTSSIADRLKAKGSCERIKQDGLIEISTKNLRMELKILFLDYGTEMTEKTSYFNQVTFEIKVWKVEE